MRKYLVLSLAATALALFAIFAPADAAVRKHGVTATQSEQLDFSARRYRRVYRYHRRYYYYYARPYYYYPYAYYGPRYYYPYYPYGYYPYYYYRRPGFYFGFAF